MQRLAAERNDPPGSRPVARRGGHFYLPTLDVLRFFSFVAVFVFHFAYLEGWTEFDKHGMFSTLRSAFFNSGRFGVDLFFTLSAYLITELLMREKEASATRSIDLRAFYIRRILRIWPLYFAAVGGMFAISAACRVLNLFHAMPKVGPALLLSEVTFLLNFVIAVNPAFDPGWMRHLWSISVEEQFYLIWPLVARKISRRNLWAVGLSLEALTSVLRLAAVLMGARGPAIWYDTFLRLDSIACGILIAAFLDGRTDRSVLQGWQMPLLAAGVFLWIAGALCPMHNTTATAVATMLAFPAAALGSGAFLLAAIAAANSLGRVWNSRLFIQGGRISYGLYVYHFPILMLVSLELRHVLSGFALLVGQPVLAFALTVIVASMSYAWLETPFLRMKNRFQRTVSRADETPVSTAPRVLGEGRNG
jgi:peptidoglycan/LPS O-acetylase OafA/YrhL